MKKTFKFSIVVIFLIMFFLQVTASDKQEGKSDGKLHQIWYIVNEFEIQNIKGEVTSFDIGWDLKVSQNPLNINSKFIFKRVK